MPHCIIEHSASLDAKFLLPLVFSSVKNSQLFAPDGADIKVRALAYQHYLVGHSKSDFIHVVLRILSGRTTEQKQQLSALVLETLCELKLAPCSITVEVVDIDRSSYAKVVS